MVHNYLYCYTLPFQFLIYDHLSLIWIHPKTLTILEPPSRNPRRVHPNFVKMLIFIFNIPIVLLINNIFTHPFTPPFWIMFQYMFHDTRDSINEQYLFLCFRPPQVGLHVPIMCNQDSNIYSNIPIFAGDCEFVLAGDTVVGDQTI